MRKSVEDLLNHYQVRKTRKQKEVFKGWLENHLKDYDYKIDKDNYSKSGTNLIVGDLTSADIVLTAHYDTQPNFYFPVIMGVSNIFTYLLSQFLMIIPAILILSVSRFIIYILTQNDMVTQLISGIVFFLYLLQLMIGIPNKHTANDNTSGVAVLLSIMEDLPYELRDKVCFVFFDQEEVGLVGAGDFKKKYDKLIENKPLINFDCVANGNNLMFITKKSFRESKYNDLLATSVKETINSERNTIIGKATKYIYTSDQIIFKNSVGVAALHKAPIFGYYLSRIHTKQDTKFDNRNIELLSQTMISFINSLPNYNEI